MRDPEGFSKDRKRKASKPSPRKRRPVRHEADDDDEREALIGAVDDKLPATVQGKSNEAS